MAAIVPRRVYLTMLARSTELEAGTVQLSPLQERSPLLLHEDDDVLVAAASLIDARRDSSWHSHLSQSP